MLIRDFGAQLSDDAEFQYAEVPRNSVQKFRIGMSNSTFQEINAASYRNFEWHLLKSGTVTRITLLLPFLKVVIFPYNVISMKIGSLVMLINSLL